MTTAAVVDARADPAPGLTVRVGSNSYSINPADAPVIIGRPDSLGGPPARIRIPDARISVKHLVLDVVCGQWTATDHSTNGTFVAGRKIARLEIADGLTVTLGHAVHGIPVYFGVHDLVDPGVAQAGAAVAARRAELDISQRTLAAQKVINAGVLINFEKGRSWPRKATRDKLERALRWPPGHIERIRAEAVRPHPPHSGNEGESTEVIGSGHTTVETTLMAETVDVAIASIVARIADLPDIDDPALPSRANATLADLMRLETVALNAARSAGGAADVIARLSTIRKTRRDLMLHVAQSPHAPLGPRLFAARHRAELTVEDAADLAGLSPDDIRTAEAGGQLSDLDTAALQRLLATLS